jgi:hypothetical protein
LTRQLGPDIAPGLFALVPLACSDIHSRLCLFLQTRSVARLIASTAALQAG